MKKKPYSDKETPAQRAKVIAWLRAEIAWLETEDGQDLMGPNQGWSGSAVLTYMIERTMHVALREKLCPALYPIYSGVMHHIMTEYGDVGYALKCFPKVIDDLKTAYEAEMHNPPEVRR